MFGAIIGDIIGSRFEFNDIKSKKFNLFSCQCEVTDDSVMSLAVARAILESDGNDEDLDKLAVKFMQKLGKSHLGAGYGGMFFRRLLSADPESYNSFGNGAVMQVSACGYAASTLAEVFLLSRKVTEVTHNHPEGLKGAEATAAAIFLARTGKSIPEEIREQAIPYSGDDLTEILVDFGCKYTIV